MKVVALKEWTDALVVSSTIAEPDTGEAFWLAATNYTVGQQVIRPNHVKYRNLIAGVDAVPPETTGIAPPRWEAIGTSNKWGALDARIGTYSIGSSPLEYVLDASGANTVAVFDMDNVTTVVLTLKIGGVPQWEKTITVPELYPPMDWYQYYYSPILRARQVLALDMPVLQGAELTVSLQSTSGNVKAGAIAVGYWREVGNVRYGAQAAIESYSRATTDANEITSIEERRVIRPTSYTFRIPNDAALGFLTLIGDLVDKASLFVGHDDNAALTVYGFPGRVATLFESPAGTVVSMDIKSLNR